MADDGKPSFLHSTTSILLLIAVCAYVLGNLLVLWFTKGQAGIGNLEGLITILLPLYGLRKGAEIVKNSTHAPPPPGGTP